MVKSKRRQTEKTSPTNAYEAARMAKIAENQARLAQSGVQKHAEDLKEFLKVTKSRPRFKRRTDQKSVFENETPLRRSERLKNRPSATQKTEYKSRPKFKRRTDKKSVFENETSLRRSERLKNRNSATPKTEYKTLQSPSSHAKTEGLFQSDNEKNHPNGTTNLPHCRFEENGEIRPANAPLPKCSQADVLQSPQRCNSESRGSGYDSVPGICCHSCEQNTLCEEEDCERCGNSDITKVCIGKTDCSRCHSSTGVFCRDCLKVQYGEDIVEVKENKNWLCPHCSEEEGSNPYWICNSNFCLQKRNIPPEDLALYKFRDMGYESVAHYLADLLRCKVFGWK